jgi:serine/threonine protein kinase
MRRARPTTPLDTTVGLDHFQVHGLCGEGTFGKVMMATKIDTQKVYAMKVIRKELLYSDATRVTQAIAEKQVMQQMAARPHPYVISLRFAFQTDENIFLVMDFMGGGDLHNLLEAKGRLREAWVVVYAAEIALALEHVHAHGGPDIEALGWMCKIGVVEGNGGTVEANFISPQVLTCSKRSCPCMCQSLLLSV